MSALVCGKRSSSVFEEHLHTPPPASKRVRCFTGASSPTALLLSPSRPSASSSPAFDRNDDNNSGGSHLASLRSLFPDMDPQFLSEVCSCKSDREPQRTKLRLEVRRGYRISFLFKLSYCILGILLRKMFKRKSQIIERALEACGNDLDSAIKGLNDLRLESSDINLDSAVGKSESGIETDVHVSTEGIMINNGEKTAENPHGADCLPTDGSEWVELFVSEMVNATDVDDARARASRVLEVLEKSIVTRAGAEAMQSFHKENMMLKEQVEVLLRENAILKRAVAIQHERQKEYDERNQELQHLKQVVSQYQEQLRTLEVNNYALTMHLRQSQQSSSIPGRFHPDVF